MCDNALAESARRPARLPAAVAFGSALTVAALPAPWRWPASPWMASAVVRNTITGGWRNLPQMFTVDLWAVSGALIARLFQAADVDEPHLGPGAAEAPC
ncbi:MAG: hypothetical protein IPI35_33720 [Deltaproteobacteria bacterium]|nr:hypothetical protein [Deltaproteobacteria bacterium]